VFITWRQFVVSPRNCSLSCFQNEENLKSSDTPDLNDLTQLLAVIMQHLPESHQDYQLTAHMVDTVQAFISSSKSTTAT
jgi:hypothetical protein